MSEEIDRFATEPPYRQIAGWLREQIEAGEYRPGQRLPSVEDLVGIWGVARLTARKALRVLIDEGLAEMTPGLGTFVRRPGHTQGTSR